MCHLFHVGSTLVICFSRILGKNFVSFVLWMLGLCSIHSGVKCKLPLQETWPKQSAPSPWLHKISSCIGHSCNSKRTKDNQERCGLRSNWGSLIHPGYQNLLVSVFFLSLVAFQWDWFWGVWRREATILAVRHVGTWSQGRWPAIWRKQVKLIWTVAEQQTNKIFLRTNNKPIRYFCLILQHHKDNF